MAMNTKHRCHVIIIIDKNNKKLVLFNIHVTIPHGIWFSLLLIVRVAFSVTIHGRHEDRQQRSAARALSGSGFILMRD